MSTRLNFAQLKEGIQPPNLIENQLTSFKQFLQAELSAEKREHVGLEAVLKELFPVVSYDGESSLEYLSYRLEPSDLSELDCLREGVTYSVSLYLNLRLKESEGGIKDEEIYMGKIPMMTQTGSFIINGAERVVVSQLHRSPGIAFDRTPHVSGKSLYSFRIIPDRGTWIECQFDQNDLLYVYLDRRRRRRKFLMTTFLRAFGCGSSSEILELFYGIEERQVQDLLNLPDLSNLVLVEDMVDASKGMILARIFDPITKTRLRAFQNHGFEKVKIVHTAFDDGVLLLSLKKDSAHNREEALRDIYKKLRPGDPPTVVNAEAMLHRLFQDLRRYDLTRVGRYKINQKLHLDTSLDQRIVNVNDLVGATKYLCKLRKGEGSVDDIDHLGSRRVKTVGELLANQCRLGFTRTERLVRERMTLYDQNVDIITPSKLVNPRVLITAVNDFFARSQLSQFMDQINILSELTHKRRLSALGPGGLNRERASFEVRDVHFSHYGRICPIETPEGPNIGLINSLSVYARINDFGFIETPYMVVEKGLITDKTKYLTADEEEGRVIAQADSKYDKKSKRLQGSVTVRKLDEVYEAQPEEVDYMDISPKQLVSVAAALIPFLEHDDANRALMGSNMQRQGVPLLKTEAPLVGTGMEAPVVADSGSMLSSQIKGKVASVNARRIVITHDGTLPKEKDLVHDPDKGVCVYFLRKFMRSNAATCFNQKPIVEKGQAIEERQIIADGASTDKGELALGRNVLTAFMSWNGYNFEDAIIISERLIKEDIYTSIHIEEFKVTARDTKLGPEEITRDIPNVSEEALANLNRDGIIRVGAYVRPRDILVGKITPKSETDLAPEEKLLRAIFGEKAADVKDTSLVVPSGIEGTVMDIKLSGPEEKDAEKLSVPERRRQIKKINEEYRGQSDKLREQLTESLSNILLGEKIPLNVLNRRTGEVIIAANRKITKTLLRKLTVASKDIEIESSPVKVKILEIINGFRKKFESLESEKEYKTKMVESGIASGMDVVKTAKVYIAAKRKIQVGDKMAGRHGNKGVIAKVVREEDMPFLPDGTPIDVILNPLGVPSRMNVGQILETHLGWACHHLGIKVATPIFDGIPEEKIRDYMEEARLPRSGKTVLYDGQTGACFDQEVLVGSIYIMKLNHLVADKIHARAVGPYSLITQQPLGGKAQYGGQRFGEMEVWALEAYGAAWTLQELLTVKSDDVQGRTRIYEQIVKGDNSLHAGIPQSFNVLVNEMKSLCLDVNLCKKEGLEANNSL